jgi:hypothetical protein
MSSCKVPPRVNHLLAANEGIQDIWFSYASSLATETSAK